MNVEAMDYLSFDDVGMRMAVAIAPTKSKELVRTRTSDSKNHGKVKRVYLTLPENNTEFAVALTDDIQLPLEVSALGTQANSGLPIIR